MTDVSARWLKASKALKVRSMARSIAEMAKKHSSEAFYAMDDPLEAAVFSVMLELVKEMETDRERR
jgi:transcriptional regulatory protein LevR